MEPSWPVFHSLQHVQGLFAANLSQDDAIRTHTQCIDDELALLDGPVAFDVGRPRLKPDDMLLLDLEFSRVFYGDNALIRRDITGKDVEQRGLTAAGSTRDNDVEPRLDRSLQHLQHGRRQHLVAQQIFCL